MVVRINEIDITLLKWGVPQARLRLCSDNPTLILPITELPLARAQFRQLLLYTNSSLLCLYAKIMFYMEGMKGRIF